MTPSCFSQQLDRFLWKKHWTTRTLEVFWLCVHGNQRKWKCFLGVQNKWNFHCWRNTKCKPFLRVGTQSARQGQVLDAALDDLLNLARISLLVALLSLLAQLGGGLWQRDRTPLRQHMWAGEIFQWQPLGVAIRANFIAVELKGCGLDTAATNRRNKVELNHPQQISLRETVSNSQKIWLII